MHVYAKNINNRTTAYLSEPWNDSNSGPRKSEWHRS